MGKLFYHAGIARAYISGKGREWGAVVSQDPCTREGRRGWVYEHNVPGTCAGLTKRTSKILASKRQTGNLASRHAVRRCCKTSCSSSTMDCVRRLHLLNARAGRTFVGRRIGLGISASRLVRVAPKGDRRRRRRD
ncbi:unnamed protein product [Ectocarpus sp. 12 AP-2014]